jgi:hypothetical protein
MLSSMRQGQFPTRALGPLPDRQFTALRLWAMDFRVTRAVGVAISPFGYTPAQKQRLHAITSAIPEMRWLVWTSMLTVIWFIVACLIIFVAMIPLAGTLSKDPNVAGVRLFLLMVGIIATLLTAYILGSLIASWIAGWILNALMPLPALEQADGDAELLEEIRRQVVRIAKFGALSAGLSLLAPSVALLL